MSVCRLAPEGREKAAEARSRATDVLQHEHDRTLRVFCI